MNKIYLDYNATAPIRPEVRDLVIEVMGCIGNASSVHGYGRAARKYVEDARQQVADMVEVEATQVIFTSGATEATNAALHPYKDKRVLISAIEHPAVFDSAPHAEKIPVDTKGLVDMDAYKQLLHNGEAPALVSVMIVNSETGVIQPIKEMAAMAKQVGAKFHTEIVQAAGRIPINMNDLGVHYMSLSAHKFAGPQGVGALIVAKGTEPPKFMRGGGQEKNCRGGTHNTPGIAGMGLAAKMATDNIATYQQTTKMRDDLESKMIAIAPRAVIYSKDAPRVGNTINIGLPDVPAQTQLMALDLDGIAVSSGSACSSGSFKPSHVLMAMGITDKAATESLRISMGWATKQSDLDQFFESWSKIVERTSK